MDLREDETGLRYLYDNALKLKITGIIRPSEKANSTMLTGSIGYTKALTEYVAQKNAESAALAAQKEQTGTDIFTGLPFREYEKLTDADYEALFAAAEDYNRSIAELDFPLMYYDQVEGYEQTLNLDGSGVMGYVAIPKLA